MKKFSINMLNQGWHITACYGSVEGGFPDEGIFTKFAMKRLFIYPGRIRQLLIKWQPFSRVVTDLY